MGSWFIRGLRKGVVTTRYPATIDPWTSDLPTAPAFHSERLTAELADRLVSVCASGALRHEGSELIIDLGRCTGCGRCVEYGDGAAHPSGAFLLATADRAALIKRVPIGQRELRDQTDQRTGDD